MRCDINEKGKRILFVSDLKEYVCYSCATEGKYMHFCEQEKRLYCSKCTRNKRGCNISFNHIDYLIDEVRLDGGKGKT